MTDAILILGGAFNPVHTQHIALLCRVKEELEATEQWNLIGGYLAVAPDNYVLHKLHSRNERTMKLEHRLALINEAMKDIPWLSNSPFQEEMLKRHDGSAFALNQRIKSLSSNHNIQTFILIGGDRMLKKGVPIWRQSSRNTSIIRVGVGRMMDGNINLLNLWQDDLNKNLVHNPREFIILNILLQSVSSSLVRNHLDQWFTSKEDSEKQLKIENDLINCNHFLDVNVMNYIKKHQTDLYIDT
jgi:nicotinic acid mononucleotide adenylyltransferase